MKDIEAIEKLLVNKGRIVDFESLKVEFSELNDVKGKIFDLTSKGFLVNLSKGKYFISKIGSLGSVSASNYLIANSIGKDSFVSFEGALKHHGIFDQGLKKYRSISTKQYLEKEIEKIVYEYVKVKDSLYFGFTDEKVDGGYARIACKERALLDLIEYKRSLYSVSLVLEKFQQFNYQLNVNLLIDFSKEYSQVTLKTLGLIFDFVNIDSSALYKEINISSTSRLMKSSDMFSAKWRLYYNSIFEVQKL